MTGRKFLGVTYDYYDKNGHRVNEADIDCGLVSPYQLNSISTNNYFAKKRQERENSSIDMTPVRKLDDIE